jgi:hypothetical protein
LTLRFVTILLSLGTLAQAGVPSYLILLWPQVSSAPPGTNDTGKNESTVTEGTVPAATPGAARPDGSMAVLGAVVTAAADAQNGSAESGRGNAARGAAGGVVVPGRSPVGPPGGSPGKPGPPSAGAESKAVDPAPSDSAELPPAPPACAAVIEQKHIAVAPAGGAIEIRATLTPPTCTPAVATSADWLQPVPTGTAGLFRFSAMPNLTPDGRTVTASIGGQSFIVEQPAGKRSLFAASPGRFVFSVRKGKAPEPKTLTLLTEEKAITFTVSTPQPWLKIEPVKAKGAKGSNRFLVRIEPAALKRGRNQSYIHVISSGKLSAPLDIPVVAEVPAPR